MIRIGVTGATGAMGSTVLDVAAERDDVGCVLASTRSGTLDRDVRTVRHADLEAALSEADVDVLVDFTVPEASVAAVEAAAAAGCAAAVGTTGFDDDQRSVIEDAAGTIPVLVAANFSRGIQALRAALEAALSRMPDADVEITETHHSRKRDAPSGTALTLVEDVEALRPDASRVHGRFGDTPRSPDDIGIHARRAGTVRGEHELLLAGDEETITLTHRSGSRRIFATGALDAAVWLAERSPGSYTFDGVVAHRA